MISKRRIALLTVLAVLCLALGAFGLAVAGLIADGRHDVAVLAITSVDRLNAG